MLLFSPRLGPIRRRRANRRCLRRREKTPRRDSARAREREGGGRIDEQMGTHARIVSERKLERIDAPFSATWRLSSQSKDFLRFSNEFSISFTFEPSFRCFEGSPPSSSASMIGLFVAIMSGDFGVLRGGGQQLLREAKIHLACCWVRALERRAKDRKVPS